MGFQLGETIGDYEVLSVLGTGGMGRVYKVRNVVSDSIEAMKVMLPSLETDPELADRFLREIKVQATIDHPNVASFRTAQRVNDPLMPVVLLIMEFVDGKTLDKLLGERGSVSVPEAVDYISQILSALGAIHARGVIHRDVKPANMMLTPSGVVKILDFGVAMVAADRRLTQTGKTVGSLFYMAPEQITGTGKLDARCDLYAAGLSLYELVTGCRPFQGNSDYSIMAAHLEKNPVPPIQLEPNIPPALNEIIMTAIAKEPEQRFQTADAMKTALASMGAPIPVATSTIQRLQNAPSPTAPTAALATQVAVPPPPSASKFKGGRRGLLAIGAVVALAVGAVLVATFGAKFLPGKAKGGTQTEIQSLKASSKTPMARALQPSSGHPGTRVDTLAGVARGHVSNRRRPRSLASPSRSGSQIQVISKKGVHPGWPPPGVAAPPASTPFVAKMSPPVLASGARFQGGRYAELPATNFPTVKILCRAKTAGTLMLFKTQFTIECPGNVGSLVGIPTDLMRAKISGEAGGWYLLRLPHHRTFSVRATDWANTIRILSNLQQLSKAERTESSDGRRRSSLLSHHN